VLDMGVKVMNEAEFRQQMALLAHSPKK